LVCFINAPQCSAFFSARVPCRADLGGFCRRPGRQRRRRPADQNFILDLPGQARLSHRESPALKKV
jgi:hypothetical protein